jgi:hypothetical protein
VPAIADPLIEALSLIIRRLRKLREGDRQSGSNLDMTIDRFDGLPQPLIDEPEANQNAF